MLLDFKCRSVGEVVPQLRSERISLKMKKEVLSLERFSVFDLSLLRFVKGNYIKDLLRFVFL